MHLDARTTDGQEWSVVRPVLPWRPRPRDVDSNVVDCFDIGDDPISMLLGILFLVVGLLFLLPLIVLLGEVLLLVLLIPFWFLGRWAGAIRWRVEVRHDGEVVHVLKIRGTEHSAEVVRELASRIARTTQAEVVEHFGITPEPLDQ